MLWRASARDRTLECGGPISSDYLNVGLTSGLPIVRQGLRSLLNGITLPASPKRRRAEKPKNRKAETREAGGPERPRSRIGLGQADLTKSRVRLPHTTGMPRSHAAYHNTGRHVATRTSHVLFSLFSSQSFAFTKPTHHPTLTATF